MSLSRRSLLQSSAAAAAWAALSPKGAHAQASAAKTIVIELCMRDQVDFGHVMVAWGFDGTSYTVNDPAGTWSQRFGGGYLNGWEPTAGRGIRYPRAAFELAIGSFDGVTIEDGSLWYHELR